MKKRKTQKKHILIRIEPDLHDLIQAYALREGRSVNNALSKIISEFLQEQQEKETVE